MKMLNELPNLGKVLIEKLRLAGINSPEELKSLGSEEVFVTNKN